MMAAETVPQRLRWGRWTPPRLIVLGAVLVAGPILLDAAVTLGANLAFLAGSLDTTPFWLALLDAALVGLLVPVGFFLVVCGILLAVLASRSTRRRTFQAALGGAGVSLASGLLLGVLNLTWYLLPLEYYTVDFLQSLSVAVFVASAAAGVGTLVAFCGIAASVREETHARTDRAALRIRLPRGKSIYRGAPSGR